MSAAGAFPSEMFADIFSFLSSADLGVSRVSHSLHAVTGILYSTAQLKNTGMSTPPLQIVHTLWSPPVLRRYVRFLTIDWQYPLVIDLYKTHLDYEFQT